MTETLPETIPPGDLPAHRQKRAQEAPRAAIIGGGPLGLEAALYASRLGHQVWLFEREVEIAPDVRAWAHVPMFTPWADNRSPLGERVLRDQARAQKDGAFRLPQGKVYPTGADFLSRYLEPLASLLGDSVLLETRVAAVGRSYMFPDEHAADPEKRSARRFRLLTRSPREERLYTADYVVDASGVTHTPRRLGAGGLPAVGELGAGRRIFYHTPDVSGRDRIHFLGKKTLLVGDGPSAATTALALADVVNKEPHGSFLWVSKSRGEFPCALTDGDPLPRRDLLLKKANLLAAKGHKRMEFLPVTQVEAVPHSLGTGKFQVTLQINHETKRFTMDTVVANVGYNPDAQTYERSLHPDEPGLYVIGQKAAPDADFLLRAGREQIRDAFRQITGRPELDLYEGG